MDSGSRLEHPRRTEQVMLRQVITALPGMTLLDADALVRSARLRHLLVVRSEILVGVPS
jgi:CBS domain-containing protein